MKKPTPEGQVMRDVAKYLNLRKHFWLRISTMGVYDTKIRGYRPSPYTIPGTPDILVVWNCQAVFIELKAPKGRQTPDQVRFQEWCKEHCIEYHIVRNVAQLQEIGL